MKRVWLVSLGIVLILTKTDAAFDPIEEVTPLSKATSVAQISSEESRDYKRFPHTMQFLKNVSTSAVELTPAGNEHLVRASHVFHTSADLWRGFFKAAVSDHITNLRAFSLIAREIKKRGVTVYGPGSGFEKAAADAHIDMGLAIPAKNIGFGVWEPDPAIKDPEFLVHLTIVYRERFIHQFPDEVLPANLKIGVGEQTEYYIDGHRHHGYLLTADLYSGPHGVGFKNVHGISGERRGLLGLFQKALFFLPDAVHSMVIDESRNTMVTEALINTTVENFETREVYRMHYRN